MTRRFQEGDDTMKMHIVLAVLAATLGLSAAEVRPVAHYSFDEDGGRVARDLSGNGLDAKLVKCAREKFGLRGRALRLNGESSYVALPGDPRLDKGVDFTCSVWFKAEAGRKHAMSLFARGNRITGFASAVYRSYAQFMSQDAGSAVSYRPVSMGTDPLAEWNNLTLVVAGGGEAGPAALRMYLNGKRLSNKGVDEFPLKGAVPLRGALTIGMNTSSEARWFAGLIDEAKVFDRALDDAEVAAEYEAGLKRVPTYGEVVPTETKALALPPLRRRRVAVYDPPKEKWIPKADPSAEWYAATAREIGCTADVVGEEALCDDKKVSAANYDTLVIPVSAIPVQAEMVVWKFLEGGGNVVIDNVVPSVFKKLADGSYDEFRGKKLFTHPHGWYAPFLVRNHPFAAGRRKMVDPLALSEEAVPLVGDLLPGAIKANPRFAYVLFDRWEKGSGREHATGDGANYALAGDVQFDVYHEPSGIGCGFTAYRYYNAKLFGPTLLQLGNVGRLLLKGEDGDRALEACLRLLEAERLPGEQPRAWHENAVKVHKAWSEYAMEFPDAVRLAKEAAALAFTRGGDHARFTGLVAAMQSRFAKLQAERKAQKALLHSRSDPAAEDAAAVALTAALREAMAECAAASSAVRAELAAAHSPARLPVRHKYGTLLAVPTYELPISMPRILNGYVDSLRAVGVNTCASLVPKWYLEDERVRAKFDGFMRDHKFVFAAGARHVTGGGRFNPANGKVADAPIPAYGYEAVSNHVASAVENWRWLGKGRQLRIGHADETGLGYNYWGSEPAARFRASLAGKYGGIEAFNKTCGTGYASFDEVNPPVRAPTTPAEHAVWELWRRFREDRLAWTYKTFYDIVKSIAPDLEVVATPSTGAAATPVYSVNYYALTKFEDVNGIDGTCCSDDMEWIYADLSSKRLLTAEWGLLYQEASLQDFCSKLWQETIAGAMGCEQFIWSFGDESVDYADHVDCPTAYGGALRSFLRDARRFDAIFLDGRRAEPEIGILFSQTARVHDHSWGWAGEKPFSPHMYSVSAYYSLFLEWGRSARVIDEGMLLDGLKPGVAALFVPQAVYLSEEVQRRLLAYARAGGRLVLEGRVGRYTEMGARSDLIFREADIMPFESVEPVTKSVGAGSVTFLGCDAALRKLPRFKPLVEGVLRGFGVTERFASSDDSLMMREWLHGNDVFLFVNSKYSGGETGWGVKEAEIAVRGRVGVEDYLFGLPVKTEFKDGYTTFRTLTYTGCRAFRLSAPPAAATDAAAMARAPKYAARATSAPSDFKDVSLPYTGLIYDVSPLRAGDYTFTLATLATGATHHDGESYLTVARGGERVRKRLFENEPRFFEMRGRTFKVTSSNNFCMFPFYSEVKIEEVKKAPPPPKASAAKTKEGRIAFSNGLVQFEIDPLKGGALSSLKMDSERFEQISGEKAYAISGEKPGPFRGVRMDAAVGAPASGAEATLTLPRPAGGRTLRETVSLADGAAEVSVRLEMANAAKETRKLGLKWHPEFVIGAAADSADVIDVPLENELRRMPFRGLGAGTMFQPGADWAAITDSKEGLSIVCSFVPDEIAKVYVWEARQMYTLELFGRERELKHGETASLAFSYRFFRGLTAVDAAKGRIAMHVAAPATHDQRKPFTACVEAATADASARDVKVSARLLRADGSEAAKVSVEAPDAVSFEVPVAARVEGDFKGLPDGDYVLEATVRSGADEIVASRAIALVGSQTERRAADLARREEELRKEAERLSRDELFHRRMELYEMRRAIERRN